MATPRPKSNILMHVAAGELRDWCQFNFPQPAEEVSSRYHSFTSIGHEMSHDAGPADSTDHVSSGVNAFST